MKSQLNAQLEAITNRIIERSAPTRQAYLARMAAAKAAKPPRSKLPCGNFAHGIAACDKDDKIILRTSQQPNIAIVTAYNDMLSAHQPYYDYPAQIKQTIRELGGVAQVAGGVPAMCDGVTQGEPGMEMSLFSRDVIALSTAVSLSHNMFDGVVMLGICDKIVPGMLIGGLSFGFLHTIFMPAGPMPSGIPNKEKARVRQQFAKGEVDRETLLEAETKSYHSAGTCTFYGTANSNQMLMEIMGVQLPGSSFENPNTPIRHAFDKEACKAVYNAVENGAKNSLAEIISEKTIINGVIGLLATGGSTNHAIHLLAMAKAAGIQINWSDISEISAIVPLIARVYPNGEADINHFHQNGGMAFVMKELLEAGLLHNDVKTVVGEGLEPYTKTAALVGDSIEWSAITEPQNDESILRSVSSPFQNEGGLQLLQGNLGESVIKISAVAEEHQVVEAPARVFVDQLDVIAAFKNDELCQDVIVVLKHQGPSANGMPELHKLTPILGSLQDQGYKVALVTDGRMSGASGKVPAAIHLSPEAINGGMIDKVQDGDIVSLNAKTGELSVQVDQATLNSRPTSTQRLDGTEGCGRELFSSFRHLVGNAKEGASIFGNFGLDENLAPNVVKLKENA